MGLSKIQRKGRNPQKEYELGIEYFHNKQYAAAVLWFKRAVEHNHPDATSDLGWCYEHDLGVKGDVSQAISLYKRAVQLGSKEARNRLDYIEPDET